jgi:hypothetical protein
MTEWMEKAACRQPDVDPEWWNELPSLAVHLCRTHCPVRAKCDEWAHGKQWHGLVVGGWLRPDGFHGARAATQPAERTAGCPTCAPGQLAAAKRGPKLAGFAPCPRCDRPTARFADGRLAAHNSAPNWRCA